VDFALDADQSAVLDAVDVIIERYGGAARARELGGDEPSYDHELHGRLRDAGFLDVSVDTPCRTDAALVVERVARGLGVVAAGYAALVAPSLGLRVDGPIAVAVDGAVGPVRFAAEAEAVVLVGERQVRLLRPSPASVRTSSSRLGWPIGEIVTDVNVAGDAVVLDGVSPDEVRAWWRVAVAAEAVGSMRSALDMAVAHVSGREQFGQRIGSFQAVQHGLAKCAVAVDGARWLAYEAAWSGDPVNAATAVSAALRAARAVRRDTHQYCGAIGFTTEYDLHLATMRLLALAVEAESIGCPEIAAATGRWSLC